MAAALAHRARHHPGGASLAPWLPARPARGAEAVCALMPSLQAAGTRRAAGKSGTPPAAAPTRGRRRRRRRRPSAAAAGASGAGALAPCARAVHPSADAAPQRARSNDAAPADRTWKVVLVVLLLCLGAVAVVMRRNGASDAETFDSVVLQRPRSRLDSSEADNLPHPRSFGAASKGGEQDRVDGASRDARPRDSSVGGLEITTRSAAPLKTAKPASGFTLDGAPTRAVEQPLARKDSGAARDSQLPRFSLDGEAAAESPRPRFGVNGEADGAAAPTARFGVNGEAADAAQPAAKPRFGANGEEAAAQEQPRFGVNGETHADEPAVAPRAPARTERARKVPAVERETAAASKLPSLKGGDAFGLVSDEPAAVTPARTKAAGILTATQALPADTLSPDDDPEPQHLLGEIHEKLSVHSDERLARFEELAANDPRSERSSDTAVRTQRTSSEAAARDAAPEASSRGGVDPAVLWKPQEKPPTSSSATSRPAVEEEEDRQPGLKAHEVDTDRHPFLDAADLLDGHPRRSEHEQTAGYKVRGRVMPSQLACADASAISILPPNRAWRLLTRAAARSRAGLQRAMRTLTAACRASACFECTCAALLHTFACGAAAAGSSAASTMWPRQRCSLLRSLS